MIEKGTYNSLILIERDIDKQIKASRAFAFLNKTAIKSFYKRNEIRLAVAHKKLNELLEEHVMKDAEGNFQKDKDATGKESYVFHTEADSVEYEAKLGVLMNTQIEIFH